jgi:hypothetical protein
LTGTFLLKEEDLDEGSCLIGRCSTKQLLEQITSGQLGAFGRGYGHSSHHDSLLPAATLPADYEGVYSDMRLYEH